jgi:hypothetical protein
MWRIYLIEFLTALILSLIWVHYIDKHKNENDER